MYLVVYLEHIERNVVYVLKEDEVITLNDILSRLAEIVPSLDEWHHLNEKMIRAVKLINNEV